MLSCQSPGLAQESDPLSSPEGITDLFLSLISGEIDEPRDWVLFKSLFVPEARFHFTRPEAPKGKQMGAMTVDEFIERVGPSYARDGFLEISLGTRVQEFNGLANVFQSFHAKNLKGSYDKKGVNSYQLVYLNDRWYITSLSFVNDTKENQIPAEYID